MLNCTNKILELTLNVLSCLIENKTSCTHQNISLKALCTVLLNFETHLYRVVKDT